MADVGYALALDGHDRDVALAILNQARQRRNPLDEIQVRHLMAIGYRAGSEASSAVLTLLGALIASNGLAGTGTAGEELKRAYQAWVETRTEGL